MRHPTACSPRYGPVDSWSWRLPREGPGQRQDHRGEPSLVRDSLPRRRRRDIGDGFANPLDQTRETPVQSRTRPLSPEATGATPHDRTARPTWSPARARPDADRWHTVSAGDRAGRARRVAPAGGHGPVEDTGSGLGDGDVGGLLEPVVASAEQGQGWRGGWVHAA